MNDIVSDHDEMDDRLSRYRLSQPTAEHRQQVLDAARAAWSENGPTLVSARSAMPVLRFAAAIAVAVLIVVLAEVGADLNLARWAVPDRTTAPATTAIAELPNLEHCGFAGRLASVSGVPLRVDSVIDLAARDRHLRELLEELSRGPKTRVAPAPDRQSSRSFLLIDPFHESRII